MVIQRVFARCAHALGFCVLVAPALAAPAAEVVRVVVDPTRVRDIGGVTRLDRAQFLSIHESPGSKDMTPEQHRLLREELDVRYGRDGGSLSWQSKRVPADPSNPDLPDVERMKELLEKDRQRGRGPKGAPADVRDVVLCTHPEHLHAMAGNEHTAWGPRNYEGIAEFTAQYLKHQYTDKNRPVYLEVFNEPFVKARKMGTTVEAMSEQHLHVARRVRELCPEVKVGGYSAAYVELELRNFQHWDSRQKTFMDIAGAEMDFFSYHIYDGVNIKGEPRVRTGSNSEAIMDLIDTYSAIQYGVAKPILITEFGGIPTASMDPAPYDAGRSAGMLYSLVGQLMTFMDHPDCLEKVIPFLLGVAEWTYTKETEPGEANVFLLWRKDADGKLVETDLMLYYKFWEGVAGEWRQSRSSNPDVRTQLWADGNRLILAMMNLDDQPKRVELAGLEGVSTKSIRGRFLQTRTDQPKLGDRQLDRLPTKITLRPGAAAMLILETDGPIPRESTVREHRVYATECLKDIVAKQPMRFRFEGVPTGEGTMAIRLSSGRELGKRKLPLRVRFNGKRLKVPNNWMGGDQAGRKNYFGMIEIPVPNELAKPSSVVEVTYPDTGGKTAAVVLQVNRRESL
ncbi:Beta-porphyranase A precursor [Planctomycetes bacterium MalM25]|nr:Beta-porphyranase A precursor [Planctomycetes bacterium MalM25]